MNRTISIILLIELFLTTTVFCRSRNDFISDAWPYLTLSWSSTADNLYDIKKFDPMISTSTFVPGKNYYDDRGEYIRNGTPGFSTALWPFEKDHTYTGMAYAYGGMDTPSGFATKLASSQKYIAGARDVDHRQHAPEGYAGYAGIDCSGLVSRLVGMSEDGTLVTDQIEISNSGADYELKYVPLATAEAGTHNVSVSVQNAFGLQEYYEFSYTLVETADSDRDGMPDSWELEMGVRAG